MPYRDPQAQRLASRERQRRYRARQKAQRAAVTLPAARPAPADPAGAVATWAAVHVEGADRPAPGRTVRDRRLAVGRFYGKRSPRGCARPGLSVSPEERQERRAIAAVLLASLGRPTEPARMARDRDVSMTGELAKELRHAIELTAATAGLPVRVFKLADPGAGRGFEAGARVDILAADKATGACRRGGHRAYR